MWRPPPTPFDGGEQTGPVVQSLYRDGPLALQVTFDPPVTPAVDNDPAPEFQVLLDGLWVPATIAFASDGNVSFQWADPIAAATRWRIVPGGSALVPEPAAPQEGELEP